MAEQAQSTAADSLRALIESGSARVGVIGLGYVGLPLALAFARAGFRVTGFDLDAAKIAALNAGRSYLGHIPAATLVPLVDAGALAASADFAGLAEMDAVLICVPTPLTAERNPDMGFVIATAEAVAARLRAGQLIVLESTTYPGTTSDLLRPILERGGLRSGADFFLAYAPEREDPGSATFATAEIPRVVGGDGETARGLAAALYDRVVPRTVPVSSTATAEAVKLTENIFRAVNIALVNELKVIFEGMGIDIWEVIEAAKTKPFGFMPFYPGPGLGGHCIPIDPFYLAWKARELGLEARFIELAGEVNTAMPAYVVERLAAALETRSDRGLDAARILLVGLAYKRNVEDTRESPAFRLIELLEQRGASVDYHDPHIPVLPVTRAHPNLAGRRSRALDTETVAGYDAVLICTDHDAVDYRLLADCARLVVDTRNAMARAGVFGDKVVRA